MEEKELENIEETAVEAVEETVEEAAQETSVAEAAEDAQEAETAETEEVAEVAEESPAEETTEATEDSEAEPEPETMPEEAPSDTQPPKKKSKAGLVVAAIIVLAAIVFVLMNTVFENGEQKSQDIVATFLDGVNEVDSEKMYSVFDENGATFETMSEFIDYIVEVSEVGIVYTMDYSISAVAKATDSYIQTVIDDVYDGSDSVSISKAYICSVSVTATVEYDGESSSSDSTMALVCYKLKGKWYLAGFGS